MSMNDYMNELEADLRARWLPSPEQRSDADSALTAGWEHVYTVQVLRNKSYGFWTTDVVVECPRGIYPDRESASRVAVALVRQIRAEGGTATAGYSTHFLDKEGVEQAAVFEDIMTWDKETA